MKNGNVTWKQFGIIVTIFISVIGFIGWQTFANDEKRENGDKEIMEKFYDQQEKTNDELGKIDELLADARAQYTITKNREDQEIFIAKINEIEKHKEEEIMEI